MVLQSLINAQRKEITDLDNRINTRVFGQLKKQVAVATDDYMPLDFDTKLFKFEITKLVSDIDADAQALIAAIPTANVRAKIDASKMLNDYNKMCNYLNSRPYRSLSSREQNDILENINPLTDPVNTIVLMAYDNVERVARERGGRAGVTVREFFPLINEVKMMYENLTVQRYDVIRSSLLAKDITAAISEARPGVLAASEQVETGVPGVLAPAPIPGRPPATPAQPPQPPQQPGAFIGMPQVGDTAPNGYVFTQADIGRLQQIDNQQQQAQTSKRRIEADLPRMRDALAAAQRKLQDADAKLQGAPTAAKATRARKNKADAEAEIQQLTPDIGQREADLQNIEADLLALRTDKDAILTQGVAQMPQQQQAGANRAAVIAQLDGLAGQLGVDIMSQANQGFKYVGNGEQEDTATGDQSEADDVALAEYLQIAQDMQALQGQQQPAPPQQQPGQQQAPAYATQPAAVLTQPYLDAILAYERAQQASGQQMTVEGAFDALPQALQQEQLRAHNDDKAEAIENGFKPMMQQVFMQRDAYAQANGVGADTLIGLAKKSKPIPIPISRAAKAMAAQAKQAAKDLFMARRRILMGGSIIPSPNSGLSENLYDHY